MMIPIEMLSPARFCTSCGPVNSRTLNWCRIRLTTAQLTLHPLYLITLHAAWRATGDKALLERHLDAAENCLEWIDKYGDRDGDGFQEYQTRSPVGYENMSWKDSGDCIVYPDGSLVKGPKALCELQGYVYDAW